MPSLPSGPIDGTAGGAVSVNTRVTVALGVNTRILNPNPRRKHALLQNQGDTGVIAIVLGDDAPTLPNVGILLYPHDVLILTSDTKGRCEWTGSVSAVQAALASTYIGVIEVENA